MSIPGVLNAIWPFLLVLGVLVFVHELGHFLVARWHGVRVITFSLGFGPKIVKFLRGGTEYCISAVPLGGYVRLAGETVQDEATGAPDEFLSQSRWVRFQVYLAGPAMNVLLAILVLALVRARGADVPVYVHAPAVIGSVAAASAADRAGIRPGDRIVAIEGQPIPSWQALNMAVLPRPNRELVVSVERDAERRDLRIVPTAETKFRVGSLGVGPVLRPEVLQVQPGRPGEQGGLRRGDVLVRVDGRAGLSREEIVAQIRSTGPKPIIFGIERDGLARDVTVVPEGREGASTIGVFLAPYEVEHVDPTLLEAFRISLRENWDYTVQIGQTLGGIFTRSTPVDQLVGPLGIAELSATAARISWIYLFELMATISLSLGLLNLLPVPVLDGGHIAILGLEGLFRRNMSVRVKERILLAGAALIVVLMVTVIFNDVARLMR